MRSSKPGNVRTENCEAPLKSLALLRHSRTGVLLIAPVCLLGIASAGAFDPNKTVAVEGHLHPLARAEFDRGAAPPDFALRGMTLMVRRTEAQQSDLDRLLTAQQDPSSPGYRKWLTPEEFADRFGATPNDLARLRAWLEIRGFAIKAVARARTFIRFDATAEQVRNAFGTEIHRYSVAGAMHYANAGPPSLPEALAPLVLGVGGMDDFAPHPDYSYSGGTLNALAPADLVAIYDIGGLQTPPLPNGTGQTVVVIGSSDVSAPDLALYCSTFFSGLTCGAVTVAFPGADPGSSDLDWTKEETMDLELVSAVAPGAVLVLDLDASVWNALYDAVDSNRGQVVLMSFGMCESLVDASLAASLQAAAQQANALGITLIAASGDTGAAGCDSGPVVGGGAHGPAVNVPASLPEATGVGGTVLQEGAGSYWGSGTATGYIPEAVWNDTTSTGSLAASGGGVSALFTKPAWQVGTSVPADGQRDVPDVALAASGVHDGYVVALGGALSTAASTPYTMGGTSAAAAVFAGMVALLNESQASASGNINAALYAIAAGSSGAIAFHDILTGNNTVPCASDSDGCTSSPPQLGWNAGAGYDLATGLGSVDEYQLLQAWPSGYNTAPAISGLSPSSAGAGSTSLPVAITGTGFTTLSSVTWTAGAQTTPLTSSCSTSTTCSATVPAALMAAPVAASIQVVSASGINSVSATFTVASAPTISGLTPASAAAGSGGFTLTIGGTNFIAGSTVYWGSTPLATTYGSATSLTAAVNSAQLASAGTQNVTVQNSSTAISASSPFTVVGPAIGSLSPPSAVAGGGVFTLTVTGTNFGSGSAVYWGAAALATTIVDTTSLTATVTSTQLASAGSPSITVQDAYGVSPGYPYTVNCPTIGSLSPNSMAAGGSSFTLSVTGTNFVNGSSTVYWGSTQLVTTFVGATSLTANITGTQLASAGTQNVTVQNSSTASSSTSAFTVSGPTITSLTPSSLPAGGPLFTLTVAGTNFNGASTVYWGATPLTTVWVSSAPLTATVTSTQLASAGTQNVTVQNTSTASSSASTFTVTGPTIISVSPLSVAAGTTPAPAIAITGANFIAVATDGSGNYVSGSQVYAGSTALAVTGGTANSIVATIPPSLIASTGRLNLTVHNPGGASSSASALTVAGPTITSLSPTPGVAGSTGFTLAVTGANFVANSTVYWGLTALATTNAGPTSLTAAVTVAELASAGSQNVTVQNSSTSSSAASAYPVNGPTITSLSSTSAVAGSGSFTLTVTGQNFINGSTVYWGPTALVTSYIGPTSLSAPVPSAQLLSAGSQSVTVQNSSTVSSTASSFMVYGPTIASLSPISAAAGGTLVTLTVTGTNFINGPSTVYMGATPLVTTYVSATSLTAAVTTAQLTSAGSQSVTVQNSSTAVSTSSPFMVGGPTIASVSPASITAGTAPTIAITLSGANFIPLAVDGSGNFATGSLVYAGSTALVVTAGSATSITATIPASLVASAARLSLTVHNPGGATSAASSVTVAGPTITSLSPASELAGDASFTLTVTGTNFVGGSTVMWGTTALATTYVGPASLTAAVASAQLASAGPLNVTVKNSSTASSAASVFTVNGPTITSLSATSMAAGAAPFTLTVTGLNFVAGSGVYWGTTLLTTTYIGATSLTASVTSAQLASAGSQGVTVQNSSATSSLAIAFMVGGPTIASLSPASAAAGGAGFTLTVAGTNFVAGSTVMWGAIPLTTTYVGPMSLTAAVLSSQYASAGSPKVTVQNSSTASSSASTFVVGGPTVSSVSPTSIPAGDPTTMVVTGANFIAGITDGSGNFTPGSLVFSGATALTVTAGTGTSITATIPANMVATTGKLSLTVHNPGGTTSAASTVMVVGPTITSLSAISIAAGGAPFTLTVTGTNFFAGSTVMWGSTALSTSYISPASLTAGVTTAQLASAGSAKVTVQNSSATSSSASTFTVLGPTIASLSVTSIAAGAVPFTLTVTGANYIAGSKVYWGSTQLGTTYGSPNSLTASVLSAQLASAGSAKITVQNISTASSSASAFTVTGPTIVSLSPASAAAGGADFTLTVTGTNFVAASNVYWGSTQLATTYGSRTSLTAAVPSAQFASTGSAKITVQNSSTASSSASTFTVGGPTITSLSPTSIAAGAATTVVVTGANFIAGTTDGSGNFTAGSVVYSGTTALTVTAGTAKSITATISVSVAASTGKLSLTVQNPGGAKSSASTVTVVGPTITSLSPTSAVAGAAAFTLTVTGTNFFNGSTVMWGSTALTTTYGSPTSVTAAVTSTQLASAASAKITVKNSSTAASSASTFTVKAPTIGSVSPASAVAGSAAFTLTVTGTNFVATSVVMWGATPLTTTYRSPTSLTAAVTSAQLASAGSPKITVQNSSTASSSASTYTVKAVPSHH